MSAPVVRPGSEFDYEGRALPLVSNMKHGQSVYMLSLWVNSPLLLIVDTRNMTATIDDDLHCLAAGSGAKITSLSETEKRFSLRT